MITSTGQTRTTGNIAFALAVLVGAQASGSDTDDQLASCLNGSHRRFAKP
jgi:hypothetical protein